MGAGAAIAFGVTPIFVKQAYAVGAEPFPLLAARFALTTVAVATFARLSKRSLGAGRRGVPALLGLGALGYALESSLFFIALRHAPAAVVGLVFYSYPLWTTLLAAACGLERAGRRHWAALALGSAGVVLVFSVPGTGLVGPLLALGSAVAVAVYMVVAQIVLEGVEPVAAATWTALGAALVLVPVSAVAGQHLPVAALPHSAAIGLATALAFLGLYGSIARIGSARSAVATMLEPVATVLLAAVFLGETLTVRVAVGASLVVAALPVLAGARADSMKAGAASAPPPGP
jgi:drug/metabolite transporter (DMT)-like permease